MYGAAVFMVLAVVAAVEVGRSLLTSLNQRSVEIEQWVSTSLGLPVKVGQTRVIWRIYKPELVFENVAVLNGEGKKPIFVIDAVKLNISLLQSLRHWQPLYWVKFAGLTFKPQQNIPGVSNASGVFFGKGKGGLLKLDSRDVVLTLDTAFTDSLPLGVVSGDITWEALPRHVWMIHVKDLKISHPGLTAQGELRLRIPAGRPPEVRLSSQVMVDRLEHKLDLTARSISASEWQADLKDEKEKLSVHLVKSSNNLMLKITSPEMKGEITSPLKPLPKSVRARFQYLHITDGTPYFLNPAYLSAFSFVGSRVYYQDQFLGRVELEVMPMNGGAQIKKLNISSRVFGLDAEGEWSGQKTHLEGEIEAPDINRFLKWCGMSETSLVSSRGHAEFDLAWSGTPAAFGLAGLSGEVTLRLGKGKVVDIGGSASTKMDFGRLLNVLSLQSLSRRLRLDFSDLSEKGYSFDSMRGRFFLTHGNAETKDTYFDGPAARIDIAGRIGLIARDYDLTLNVTPYMTGSLPLVAAMAGGPLAGAAGWIVEKMVSSTVARVTTYHYHVTGPWSDPVWKEIK
jgi:uncharacterized protein YhdP